MVYPKEVNECLVKARENVFKSEEDFLLFRREAAKCLVIYQDDLYHVRWILDLSNFNHPSGVGPTKKDLQRSLEVTEDFNRAGHGNREVEELLSKAVACII